MNKFTEDDVPETDVINSATETTNEESTTTKRIVCPMLTQSEIAASDLKFKLDRIDWNLCTHVISGDERGNEGMKSLINGRRNIVVFI